MRFSFSSLSIWKKTALLLLVLGGFGLSVFYGASEYLGANSFQFHSGGSSVLSGSSSGPAAVPFPFRPTSHRFFQSQLVSIPANPSVEWCAAYSEQCRGQHAPYGMSTQGRTPIQAWCINHANACLVKLSQAGLEYDFDVPPYRNYGDWCSEAAPICDVHNGQRIRGSHDNNCEDYWNLCTSEPLPPYQQDPVFDPWRAQQAAAEESSSSSSSSQNTSEPSVVSVPSPFTPTTHRFLQFHFDPIPEENVVGEAYMKGWCQAYLPQCVGVPTARTGANNNWNWCGDFEFTCQGHLAAEGYPSQISLQSPVPGGLQHWCQNDAHTVCAWGQNGETLGHRRFSNISKCPDYYRLCTSESLLPMEEDPTFAEHFASSGSGSSAVPSSPASTGPSRPVSSFSFQPSGLPDSSSGSARPTTLSNNRASSAEEEEGEPFVLEPFVADPAPNLRGVFRDYISRYGLHIRGEEDGINRQLPTGAILSNGKVEFPSLPNTDTRSSFSTLSDLLDSFELQVEDAQQLLSYKGSILSWSVVYKLYALSLEAEVQEREGNDWYVPYEAWFKRERPEFSSRVAIDPALKRDVLQIWGGILPEGVTEFQSSFAQKSSSEGDQKSSKVSAKKKKSKVQQRREEREKKLKEHSILAPLYGIDAQLLDRLKSPAFPKPHVQKGSTVLHKGQILRWSVLYKLYSQKLGMNIADAPDPHLWYRPHEGWFKQQLPQYSQSKPGDAVPEEVVLSLWGAELPEGVSIVSEANDKPLFGADESDEVLDDLLLQASELIRSLGYVPPVSAVAEPVFDWIDKGLPAVIDTYERLVRERSYWEQITYSLDHNPGFYAMVASILGNYEGSPVGEGSIVVLEETLSEAIDRTRISLLESVKSFFEGLGVESIDSLLEDFLADSPDTDIGIIDCSATRDGYIVDESEHCHIDPILNSL